MIQVVVITQAPLAEVALYFVRLIFNMDMNMRRTDLLSCSHFAEPLIVAEQLDPG